MKQSFITFLTRCLALSFLLLRSWSPMMSFSFSAPLPHAMQCAAVRTYYSRV